MYERVIQAALREMLSQYPVVTLTGPRQSGKSTLAKMYCADKPFFNLEEPDTREMILADPRGFFNRHPEGAVLDEIQCAPELISYIQGIVDQQFSPGQFVLTGSYQLELMEAVSQSLAGRTALLELLPLSLQERQLEDISLDECLLQGFFPGVVFRQLNPSSAYRNYVKTYLERDVRRVINIQDLDRFQRFVRLSAGRVGSVLNKESLANDVGTSNNTIKQWLNVLEASYLSYRLQPHFENFNKRIIKSPKLYFSDVGLVSYLLGIESPTQMNRDRMRGFLFENLVFLELLKYRLNQGREASLFYYRDNHQNEVDFIIQQRDQLIPIEVKSTSTFDSALLKNLTFYQKLVGRERVPTGFLVYGGERRFSVGDFHVMPYREVTTIYEQIDHE